MDAEDRRPRRLAIAAWIAGVVTAVIGLVTLGVTLGRDSTPLSFQVLEAIAQTTVIAGSPEATPSTTSGAQPGTPTSTAAPEGTRTESLGPITVFGNSNAGVQITIPETGVYRFAYRGGAYATYAIGVSPSGLKTWLTSVFIFQGSHALWDGRRIRDENLFLRLADMHYWDTAEEAESAAEGQYVEAQLSQGEVLTLIAVDHYDAYADNPGQVVLEWFLVGH